MLAMCSGQAAAEYTLEVNVVCPEGYFVGGEPVVDGQVQDGGTLFVRAATDVMVDWSDDIVYHQWTAGSKVRVEVVLTEPATGAYVYTLGAHFQIEQQLADGSWTVIYGPRSIGGDLWIEGPDSQDAYRAEINSEGWLLYGFNWDTKDLGPGAYRLSFWVGDVPAADPLGNPIVPLGVDITTGAAGDTSPTSGEIFATVGYDFAAESSFLVLELLPKEHGRGISGK
jgi:hypothetical protein